MCHSARPDHALHIPLMLPSTQPIVPRPLGLTSYSGYHQPINTLPHSRPYLETDKLRALAVYAETGNQQEASRQTGIPRTTVQGWVEDEGAESLVAELRQTVRYNEGWRVSKLFSRTLDKIERVLDEGDEVMLKDGRILHKAQPYRDLVVGASILLDKWMLISGSISNETMLLGKMNELSTQLQSLGTGLASPTPDPPAPGTPIGEVSGEKLMW